MSLCRGWCFPRGLNNYLQCRLSLKTSVFISSLHIRVIIVIELRFVRIGRLILIGKKSVSPISDQTNFDRGEHIVRDAFGIRIKPEF